MEKWSGDIKGRMVANRRKQRRYTGNLEVTSPTVISDSIMLTATIEAAERRGVIVLDLPGAFLSADMDKLDHMVLRGN